MDVDGHDQHDFGHKVRPVHRKVTRGEEYTDRYTFGEVKFGFHPEDVLAFDADKEMVEDDVLMYQYKDSVPLKVVSDGAYRRPDDNEQDAQNQAYFVLSQLDSAGYVTNWHKK